MYWYEDEVKRLEKNFFNLEYKPETIFYGSSSIRLWTTLNEDFLDFKPLNLGFGGSTLAACVWFYERIMGPYQPQRLMYYAGDNDLGDGRNPEEVFIFFQQLVVKTKERFGDIPCYYISLKPSPSRLNIIDHFKYTNNLIENEIIKLDHNWHFINVFKHMLDPAGRPRKELFGEDGLHLSQAGYQLWKDVVTSSIIV